MQILSLGKVTPAGTEAAINAGTPTRTRANKVLIFALEDNDAAIWVGLSGLNTTSKANCIRPLAAGDELVIGDEQFSNVVELDKLFVLGSGTDAVLVTAFVR